MDYNEQAAALLEEAKNAKRTAHQARRRAKSALSRLDELKRRCREFGIKLVVDDQILVDGTVPMKEGTQPCPTKPLSP